MQSNPVRARPSFIISPQSSATLSVEVVMDAGYRVNRWTVVSILAAVAIVTGIVAYQFGVSHGLAMSTRTAFPGPGVPYGWYRPWGFGFPFLFIALWFLLLRGLFWGGRWHRRHWDHLGPRDVPSRFDEWHRRAHEQMKAEGTSSNHA